MYRTYLTLVSNKNMITEIISYPVILRVKHRKLHRESEGAVLTND